MGRLQATFKRLRARGEGALIGYLMAGDPDPERSYAYARALIAGGVDVLELGLPFSDPIADGPVIQAASVRALRAGTTPAVVLELVRRLRRESPIPIVLMTYYNPILAMGEAQFCKRCMNTGIDGLVVPDLPVEEAEPLLAQARRTRIDVVFLATPETDDGRLERIAQATSGFLYLVARYGVTGASTEMGPAFWGLIQRVRAHLPEELPLAVGFGIARPEQVRTVLRAGAQGAIVGTAFVQRVADGAPPEALRALAQQLKAVTRSA
jgi:tryptophan synthase alpha chain